MVGSFDGLLVLARANAGKQDLFKGDVFRFLNIEQPPPLRSSVAWALAFVGMGRTDEALAELEQACNDGHPLMVWLHIWPVLDPLRERKRFKKLIARMNLPV